MGCLRPQKVVPRDFDLDGYDTSLEELHRAATLIQRKWRSARSMVNKMCAHRRPGARIHKIHRAQYGKTLADYSALRSNELAAYRIQLHRFLRHPLSTVSDPTQLSSMITEVFVLLVVICWVMTAIVKPETFESNPLLDAWGYNNICVGFDEVPMRYVAGAGWCVLCAVTMEYTKALCGEIMLKEKLGVKRRHSRVVSWLLVLAHLSFFFSTCFFMLCFLIPPTESRQWHTRPFEVYIICRYLSLFACCFEYYSEYDVRVADGMPLQLKVYLAVLGALSLFLPIAEKVI